MRSVNPATGEPIAEYPEHDPAEVQRRLERAAATFATWRRTSFAERSAILVSVARVLSQDRDRFARLMTIEMGKPIAQAEAEVEKCAWCCEHFAEHAERYLAPREIATDAARSLVRYDPLGVVLAIMPWNFPFWQVIRCAAPALMAGDTVVLKHASNVCGCALALESLFGDAGAPPGLFTALLVSSARVEALIEHPRVAAVSLTGSETAGIAVGRSAGAALKRPAAYHPVRIPSDQPVAGAIQNRPPNTVAVRKRRGCERAVGSID